MTGSRLLAFDGFEPAREGWREALTALGNGVFVTRGAAAWSRADGTHYPGTYLAGGYDRVTSQVSGRDVENEDLVNLPNWLPVSFRRGDGPWFRGEPDQLGDYRQVLDLDDGILHWDLVVRHAGVRSRWYERRAVHMGRSEVAVQEVTIDPLDWSGAITVRAGLDAAVENAGVARYRPLEGRHLEVTETGGDGDTVWAAVRTTSSRFRVAVVARIEISGLADAPAPHVEWDEKRAHLVRTGSVQPGRPVTVRKVVALVSDRHRPLYEPLLDGRRVVRQAPGTEALFESHRRAWERLWARSRLRIETTDGDDADLALRLHLFHLHQTVSDHTADLDVGIPARGWHGEAYRGHVFWDELFVLPFLDYRVPERSRAAIRYRSRRLGEARRAAAAAGHRGAMFPWQSGSTGREESQTWHLNPRSGRWLRDPTHLQRHVGLAIAYNVWQHWAVTADHEFLHQHGAPLLLAVADFFASLARWDPGRERYVIRGVVGPDEYHTAYPGAAEPGLDNNAYTNVMAAWVLRRAQEVVGRLLPRRRAELFAELDLDRGRLEHWDEVAGRLFVPFLPGRIIEQFEGYGDLAEFDWEGYRERYGDIARLDRILEAEGDTPNRYRASKQADVVMLFYLLTARELCELLGELDYDFHPDDIPRNVDFYMDRTSHGSTLSSVVHSWVLARTDRSASWGWYRHALASDIGDAQGGTTAEGIHLGAMAGTVELLQRGYTGLCVEGDVVRFNPRLPAEVASLSFALHFRSRWDLAVRLTQDRLIVRCESSGPDPLPVAVKDEVVLLPPGGEHRFDLRRLKGADVPPSRSVHPGAPVPAAQPQR